MAPSSSSSQEKYEVFLSFRGEDTRDGFTGHLYNALCQKHINTFKDDENLESGHKISEIMDAIKESKVCIIVFSKDFASSTWCLNEVVRILECKRGANDIIPIFYGIEPSIVRKQEQSYAVSFGKHEQRFKDNMDKVQHWRDALNEVAAISGHDSKNTRPEYKFIDEIVEDILLKLSRYPSTCDHSKQGLIGIENRVEEIEELLCIDSLDFRIIGLYGMGGIGKTTLALAVFQKLSHHFESHCFLGNVREEYENHRITELRKQLLSQLFYHDKTIPSLESTHFQERLCRTKVLIVLDDLVDAISQLNELLPKGCRFGAGSRIIVTARDAQLLKSMADKVYKVEGLNYVDALKLFCLHAFKNDCDREGYESLSKTVADYAGGNPLALEVLGSSLRSKSVEEWKSALDELQTEPNPKIEKVLRLSFDQLGKKDKKHFTPIQDVFLDFACLYDNGVDRKFVENVIHHSGATKKISDLIDKCLIIEDYNRLSMHSLIRQMGRTIVVDKSNEPGNRSRLWKAEDVRHVLERNTGSCKIEAILLDQSKLLEHVTVRRRAFSKMRRLRFLRFFYEEYYRGSPDHKICLPPKGIKNLTKELRYLQWDLYPSKYLPSKFCPEYLVELVMRGSQLVKLPWNEGQPLGNLKKIDLSYCKGLIQIQNLCAATNLESINLEGCSSLVQVPSGFRNLKKLEDLDLSSCEKLKDGLENLPLNIVWLSLSGTAIEALPSEFRRLSNFKDFYLDRCKKLEDIQNISSSMGITELDLDQTAIKTLPKSIWKMSSLKRLTLWDCPNLEKLPEITDDCIGSSLEDLNISGCRLKSVPESIWKLSSLESLTLNDCPNLEKLQEISDDCMSSSLEGSDIRGCTRLKLRPMQNLCGGTNLQWINLERCTRLVQVPSWFKNLNKLEYLDLGCCKNLKDGLENLPLNIVWLSLSGTAIEALPSEFRRLSNFKDFYLDRCKKLEDIQNISSSMGITELDLDQTAIKTLPKSIWKMSSLKRLTLRDCPNLEKLPEILDDCIGSSLEGLNISSCMRLKSVSESIWKMSSLKSLTLWDCPNLEKLPEITDDCIGSSLEDLNMSGCMRLKSVSESIWKLSSLESLTLWDCPNLEKLPEITADCIGSSLEDLSISGCMRLKSVPESIWKMSSLKRLTLRDCPNLEKLPEITDDCIGSSLEDLNISGCMRLKSVPESIRKMSSLKSLTLRDCPNLEKLPEITDDCIGSSLEDLNISGCMRLKSVPESIWKLSSLESLTLNDCPNLEKLQEISDDCMSSSLEGSDIRGCTRLKLRPMQNLCGGTNLRWINLERCTRLVQVPSWFKNLNKLEHLDLGCCKNLKDGLENLPLNIEVLSFYGTAIEALPSSLGRLLNLEYLNLSHCKNLRDGIENLPLNLRTLYLSDCTRLKSIPVLPSSLKYLDASNCASLDASICASLETMSRCQAVYTGNEIPEWFSHQTDDGNSSHIHLPPNWFPIHDPLFGFLFSVVFRLNGYVSSPHILLEIHFKTNVNSDDFLHCHYPIRFTFLSDGGREIYGCEMESDHVFIADVKLNLEYLFGEEWSSVCGNVTEVSFRVSIEGNGVIDWEIKKFGFGLVNTWGTARKSKRRFGEYSGQPSGYQDKVDSHDPHANSKRIKAQQK